MSPLTLLIIIIVVMIGLGVGAWFFLRSSSSNPASRLFRKFFTKPQVQPVILISEDGVARLMEFTIPVSSFMLNPTKEGAWHLVHNLMLPLQGVRRHVLVVNERNTVPYNPFVALAPSKLAKIQNVDAIADEGGKIAIMDGIKNSRNNMIASALVICACAVAFVFILFIGFQYWQNGGINFGGGSVK